MTYRNDLEALEARHTALEAEVAVKAKERDEAARMLEQAKAQAKLPVLANIRVATPCRAEWNAMTGDDRVRACGSCEKNVYNLTSMTRAEAEALIVEREGKLCIRYFQRTDGTILLKDCAIGIKQKRKRRFIVAGAATLLAGAAGFLETRANDSTLEMTPFEIGQAVSHNVPDGNFVMGGSAMEYDPGPLEAPPPRAMRGATGNGNTNQ